MQSLMAREDSWATEEPDAKKTGWRIPHRVRKAVDLAALEDETTAERLVTGWLIAAIERRKKSKPQR
jgi:hypothetical protein